MHSSLNPLVSLSLSIIKWYIHCSVKNWGAFKNNFTLNILTRTKNCEFSFNNFANFLWFCYSIFTKFLNLTEIVYIFLLFCTSDFEREKFSRIIFMAIGVPKKNSKKYWKNNIQECCTKKYTLAPDAANHTFFSHPYII